MIAHHATGSLRDAESLLDQLVVAPGDTITLERAQKVLGTASDEAIISLTSSLLAGDGAGGLAIIHQAFRSGADARQFARQMVAYLRKLLLLQTAGQSLPLNITLEQQEVMIRQAQASKRQLLVDAVKQFNEAATTQTGSWQPQLPLELAFIELLPQQYEPPEKYSQPDEIISELRKPLLVAEPGPAAESIDEEESLSVETRGESEASEESISGLSTAESSPKEQDRQVTKLAKSTMLSLEQITAHWPQLRENTGQQDKSLPALLASCKPLAVENEILSWGSTIQFSRTNSTKSKGQEKSSLMH